MAVYTLGFSSVAAAAGAAYATIHTPAGTRARILEIGLACNAATASPVGLIRPSNTPVATTSQLGQAEDPADGVSVTNIDTAWSTAPTVGTLFLRKFGLPATIGAGLIWAWSDASPLVLNASTYLVLWNFGGAAGSVLNGYMKWRE